METTSSEDIASPTYAQNRGGFRPAHPAGADRSGSGGTRHLACDLSPGLLLFQLRSALPGTAGVVARLLLLLAAYEVQIWIHRGIDTCTAAHSYSER
jgi:hypothetical protein